MTDTKSFGQTTRSRRCDRHNPGAREGNLMAVDTEEAEIIAAAEKSECSDIIRERSELIDERNALLVKVGEARAEGTAQGRRGLAREFLSDMAIGWPEMLRKLREAAK